MAGCLGRQCDVGLSMQASEFVACHQPALERDEVRHNILLGMMAGLADDRMPELRLWSLGAPGACAMQAPGYSLVLGDVSRAQCRALADETRDVDHAGVVGPDQTASWFAEHAGEQGLTFLEPIPQQIQVLREQPIYPGAPGHARPAEPADADLLADWVLAFAREAVPQDPPPNRERVVKTVGGGRYCFWIVDGMPVAMAGIARRTRHAAAISGVYTPPALRGRGYAGSVTAAVVERIFAEGRTAACLYTDLRNPFSNRCYARIGFRPSCESWHYPRAP
jgi:RimJ/RimL family protein N-acetyltransferase